MSSVLVRNPRKTLVSVKRRIVLFPKMKELSLAFRVLPHLFRAERNCNLPNMGRFRIERHVFKKRAGREMARDNGYARFFERLLRIFRRSVGSHGCRRSESVTERRNAVPMIQSGRRENRYVPTRRRLRSEPLHSSMSSKKRYGVQ